jgi:hypothetical protein
MHQLILKIVQIFNTIFRGHAKDLGWGCKCPRKFYQIIISVLVIQAHAAEGYSFLKQHQKGNPEKL